MDKVFSARDLLDEIPSEKLEFIKGSLIKQLDRHLRNVNQVEKDLDTDLLEIMQTCIDRFGVDNSPEIQPRILDHTQVIVPSIIYWSLDSQGQSQSVSLEDLVIPIGPGLDTNHQVSSFALNLTGKIIALSKQNWYIPLPIFNGLINNREDVKKFLKVKPCFNTKRLTLTTSYTHKRVLENDVVLFKAYAPGIYDNGKVVFRGAWGYPEVDEDLSLSKDSRLSGLVDLYLGDTLRMDDRRLSVNSSILELQIRQDEVYVILEEESLNLTEFSSRLKKNDKSVDLIRSEYYHDTKKNETHQDFDKELRIRENRKEFDYYLFDSERDCLKALRNGLIHRYQKSPDDRFLGFRYLDLRGFNNWYSSQIN